MFVFIASKLIALLTQPLLWVVMLLIGSLLVRRRPAVSRRLVGVGLVLLLVLGWQPLPNMLIHQLESQYPEIPPGTNLSDYVGVIVLGGATEPGYLAQAHSQPLLNDAAERMTAPMGLLRVNPTLHVLYTGGEGALWGIGPSEAARAQVFFENQGLPREQVQYEANSRNTFENAHLTAQLPNVDIAKPWLLVTSAWHMPRSMATFSKAGWNVTAYPVDYRTGPWTPWTEYSLASGIRNWQLVLHEHIGSLAYRIAGRM